MGGSTVLEPTGAEFDAELALALLEGSGVTGTEITDCEGVIAGGFE